MFVISRRSRCRYGKKCTKKTWYTCRVVVLPTKPIALWRTCCRRRHSFVRSLLVCVAHQFFLVSYYSAREENARRGEVQYYSLILQSVCYHGVALTSTWSTNAAKPLLSCVQLFACSKQTPAFNSFVISKGPVGMDVSTSLKSLSVGPGGVWTSHLPLSRPVAGALPTMLTMWRYTRSCTYPPPPGFGNTAIFRRSTP